MKRVVITVAAALAVFLFASCTGPMGPAGKDIPGSVYIVDGNNYRIYSGGTIDLGQWVRTASLGNQVSYKLVNQTGTTLTATKNGTYLVPVSGNFFGFNGTPSSVLGLNGETLPELGVSTDLPSGTLPATGATQPFTIQYSGNSASTSRQGEIQRKYAVALSDGSGNNYNFAFEVYGVVSC